MLEDLDATLKVLLERSLPPDLATADIPFDTPDGDFA
jgi:hypothetical protein